jgi:hypothetical protein
MEAIGAKGEEGVTINKIRDYARNTYQFVPFGPSISNCLSKKFQKTDRKAGKLHYWVRK